MEESKSEREIKKAIYEDLTSQFPCSLGKDISKVEREEKLQMDNKALVYGELVFDTLADIFDVIREKYGGLPTGGKFFDLGSGTGKP
jgi:hypothetical protein